MQDFEKAFSEFIDRKEYDSAENALFSMIRISFKAGWIAAGGKAPGAQRPVELLIFRQDAPIENHSE
ncbi:MAG: hypothetical protein FWG94_10370 [Oscillospiraceae bacterium]|nr:hypothetical protein [Oscillospiraceae bacterium]